MENENSKKQGRQPMAALWIKTSKDGTKYLSGQFDKRWQDTAKAGDSFVVFKCKNKQSEKHPDYIAYKSEPLNTAPVAPKEDF